MLQNPNPSFSDASSNAPSIFWKMGMDVLVEFDFKFFLIQGVGLQARIKLNKKVKTKESSDRMQCSHCGKRFRLFRLHFCFSYGYGNLQTCRRVLLVFFVNFKQLEKKLTDNSIVPQESTANSNLGCGTIITSGTIAGIRNFWLRYFYYQRYFYLRLESIY